MGVIVDNRIMSVGAFRACWSLASAYGHHWAMAVGDPLPADGDPLPADATVAAWSCGLDIGEPHPYAGLPVPPGRADGWTPALIEAVAKATETGPCGGVMGPCNEHGEFAHRTASGRLEWTVVAVGEADADVSLFVCRPVPEETDPCRSAVLIATVLRGVLALSLPAGHWRGHQTAGVEARHVEALAVALGALGVASPIDAIREAAHPLAETDRPYADAVWAACREAKAERLVYEARRLRERALRATEACVAQCVLWEASCLADDLAAVSTSHAYLTLALARGAGEEGTPVERCRRLAEALTAAFTEGEEALDKPDNHAEEAEELISDEGE